MRRSGGWGASLAARIQSKLSSYYGIEGVPEVDGFVRPVDGAGREALLVREHDDELEMALELPRAAVEGRAWSLDVVCQVVEGVSHFLYVAERARRGLSTTQLELEIQAEVDKYVLLVADGVFGFAGSGPFHAKTTPESARGRAAVLHDRLFGRVRYTDPEGTETGDRYRMANALAARFARRVERLCRDRVRAPSVGAELRRFYWTGQAGKIELARAA